MVLVFGVRPAKVLAFGKGEPFSHARYGFDALDSLIDAW
jgi:hypothetical protein